MGLREIHRGVDVVVSRCGYVLMAVDDLALLGLVEAPAEAQHVLCGVVKLSGRGEQEVVHHASAVRFAAQLLVREEELVTQVGHPLVRGSQGRAGEEAQLEDVLDGVILCPILAHVDAKDAVVGNGDVPAFQVRSSD